MQGRSQNMSIYSVDTLFLPLRTKLSTSRKFQASDMKVFKFANFAAMSATLVK